MSARSSLFPPSNIAALTVVDANHTPTLNPNPNHNPNPNLPITPIRPAVVDASGETSDVAALGFYDGRSHTALSAGAVYRGIMDVLEAEVRCACSTEIYTRGCHWSHAALLHACDQ
jgi:hypothetical protein